jgi:type II secretory pathway component PulC
MDQKYLKDFVIALVVMLILAFAVKNFYLYEAVNHVPKESRYKNQALSQDLIDRIFMIENSIQERKGFVFTVTKDPLEQNLIVRTQKDLEAEWKEMVKRMVRLESTIIPAEGAKRALIAHGGTSTLYSIGDTFDGNKRIVDIRPGEIVFALPNGQQAVMDTQKIPPKPLEIQNNSAKNRPLNW